MKNEVDPRSNGFTLIELLVVVLIIGILSAIALPQYQFAVERSRAAEAAINVKALANACEMYYLANGDYPFKGPIATEEELQALDVQVRDVNNFRLDTYYKVYVGLQRKAPGPYYMISQTMRNQRSSEWAARKLTCNTAEMADSNSVSSKICKTLCGTDTLHRVWGSGEFGCEIG